MCKSCLSHANKPLNIIIYMWKWGRFVTRQSRLALLLSKGQGTEHTTVKWPVMQATVQMQGKIGQGQVIKWRERNVFRWTPEFVSVELSYVKKIPKNKGSFEKFWKWQLNLRWWKTWKRLSKTLMEKSWNLKSSEDYEPCFFTRFKQRRYGMSHQSSFSACIEIWSKFSFIGYPWSVGPHDAASWSPIHRR